MSEIDHNYDDLLGDLQKIGYVPWVGYMWCGQMGYDDRDNPPFLSFAVIGPTEIDCIKLLMQSGIFTGSSARRGSSGLLSTTSTASFGGMSPRSQSMPGYLDELFENGVIRDSGHYSGLEPKKNEKLVRYWTDEWRNDPYYFVKVAKEMFSNVDQVMSQKTYSPSQDKTWKP